MTGEGQGKKPSWLKRTLFSKSKIIVFLILFVTVGGVWMLFASNASTTQTSTTTINNSASRLMVWTGINDLVKFNYSTNTLTSSITDAQLDYWKSHGVGGFTVQLQFLYGMGGQYDFTGDPAANLSSARYGIQREMINKNIVGRLHARGMKLYIGYRTGNYNNKATPFVDWFNDTGWQTTATAAVKNVAAAAKLMGADGISLDTEPYYPGYSWDWNYPGNTHTQSEVRAKAKQRGQELMTAMLSVYPNLTLTHYHLYGVGSWSDATQCYVNNACAGSPNLVMTNFFDGLTSVPGYAAINHAEFSFYKGCNVPNCQIDAANQYNANGIFSYISSNWSNPSYQLTHYNVSPFIWIDEDVANEGPWAGARSVPVVTDQLQKYRKWGMGGEFQDYAYKIITGGGFDYSPYFPAMQATSVLGTVDSQAPSLNVTTPAGGSATTSSSSIIISGNAKDDQAIRYISWTNDKGGSGMFPMTWQVLSGDYKTSYNWQMNFTTSIPLVSGANNITVKAVDIHNNTTSQVVNINGGTAPPPDSPPTVSLTVSPTTVTQGGSTTLTAAATDTDSTPISKVEFYDGTTLLNTDTTSPYSFTWTTTSTSTGTHYLTAKAYDTANLNNTSSTIPVTVNAPTSNCAKDYNPVADAYVAPASPTTNFGSDVSVRVDGTDTPSTGYLRFDLSPCAGQTISSAKLIVSVTGGSVNTQNINNVADIIWGEATITNNNAPAFGGLIATNPGGASGATVTIDVTSGAAAKAGSLFSLAISQTGTDGFTFYSKEGTVKPVLRVTSSGSSADTTSPTAPTGLKTNGVTYNQVTLSWIASTDNVAVAGYNIMRNGTKIGSVSGTTLTYTDAAAVASTTYNTPGYVVTAVDAAGNTSASSNAVVVTTPAPPDTTAPTAAILSAPTKLYNKVSLSWTASTDNVAVTGYDVMRNGTKLATVAANVTTYDDTSVTASTTYNSPGYSVVAFDGANNRTSSNAVVVTTPAPPDTTPPSAPTGLTATAAAYNKVNLTWTASTDNVGVTGYSVRRATGTSSPVVIATVTTTGYSDTTAQPSTSYTYSIVASDAAGNASATSNNSSVTTPAVPDTISPSVPTGLSAAQFSNTQVNLAWTASTDNTGVTNYKIIRTGGTAVSFTSTTTSFGDGTVAANVAYSYTVQALDAAGNISAASAPATITVTPTALDISKTTTAPVIDGNLAEYATATPVTFTNSKGNAVTFKALWDNNNLYLAYNANDTKLNGIVTARDGALWGDDAVEWFIDTLHNGGGSGTPTSAYLLADDYQGIVNILNAQYDGRGSSTGAPTVSWNGTWQSAVIKTGTVGNNADTDSSWQTEVRIPWTTIGFTTTPASNTIIGLSFARDDRDATNSAVMMWGGITTAFQNASKWQTVRLK